MHSTLIVARLRNTNSEAIANLFAEFDNTEMPHLMGTRRRQLFQYNGLYFHLQDFDTNDGGRAIEAAKQHPLFIRISEDLKPYIEAYDPAAWKSPKDALATRFYSWTQSVSHPSVPTR